MLELIALSAGLLLSAACIFLVQHWRRRKHRAALRLANPKLRSYAAVGIRIHTRACGAVRKYYGKRFLCDEAPAMPVIGCKVRRCPCRYVHYLDRRAEDRRAQFGVLDRFHGTAGNERRRSDRRGMPASTQIYSNS